MLKVSHIAAGRTQPANSNFLLFHINTDHKPPALLLSFFASIPLICFYLRPAVPATMIGALHHPLPSSLSNDCFPAATEGGLSSQPHCWFSTGKLPHSSTQQTSPPTASDSCLSPFSFVERISYVGFHLGHGYPVDARCSPSRHPHRPPSFCLIPPIVHHAFAAGWRLAQLYGQLGQCSHGMSLPSDWSGVSRWQPTGHTAETT